MNYRDRCIRFLAERERERKRERERERERDRKEDKRIVQTNRNFISRRNDITGVDENKEVKLGIALGCGIEIFLAQIGTESRDTL